MPTDQTLPDPTPVLDLLQAFRWSMTMFAAISHGVFDALDSRPQTCATLGRAVKRLRRQAARPHIGNGRGVKHTSNSAIESQPNRTRPQPSGTESSAVGGWRMPSIRSSTIISEYSQYCVTAM